MEFAFCSNEMVLAQQNFTMMWERIKRSMVLLFGHLLWIDAGCCSGTHHAIHLAANGSITGINTIKCQMRIVNIMRTGKKSVGGLAVHSLVTI